MDEELSRRTQCLLHQAEQLLVLASEQMGGMQLACEAGAVALIERGLAALVAELAAPQPVGRGNWQQLLTVLPDTLQERRLLERALLTVDGELYDLYCRLEQQYAERRSSALAAALIVTTTSPNERIVQLRSQLSVLRQMINVLREYSRFC